MTEKWYPLVIGCLVKGCKNKSHDIEYYCGKCMLALEVNQKVEVRCPTCKIKVSFLQLQHGCKDCVHINPKKIDPVRILWAFSILIERVSDSGDEDWVVAWSNSVNALLNKFCV